MTVTQTQAKTDALYQTGYLSADRKTIIDWAGHFLGEARVKSQWKTPESFASAEMYQIEALIDGVFYTGRGSGESMLWKGKRKTEQKWSVKNGSAQK